MKEEEESEEFNFRSIECMKDILFMFDVAVRLMIRREKLGSYCCERITSGLGLKLLGMSLRKLSDVDDVL